MRMDIEERLDRVEKEVMVRTPHRQQLAILKADVDCLWHRMSQRNAMNDQLEKVIEGCKTQMMNLESLMNELKRYDDIENKNIGKVIYE